MNRCKNKDCIDYDVGYRDSDSFCGECGNSLKEEKKEDDNRCECKRFIVSRWKFCPNCGKLTPKSN